jgi:hypothetical protein
MATNAKYEYIRIHLDFGDLGPLNRYSGDGWKVVAIIEKQPDPGFEEGYWALLEREIQPQPWISVQKMDKSEVKF